MRKEEEFDGQTTLLWGDVTFGKNYIDGKWVKTTTILVKSPEIDKIGARDAIMVFQLDTFMCSIQALEKYMVETKIDREPGLIVFRLETGGCMTGDEFNGRFRILTKELVEWLP